MSELNDQEDVLLLWQSAIAEYQKETDRKVSAETLKGFQELHTPDELLKQITASGQSFEDFRSKRAHLWSRLKTFATPLQTILTLASTATSAVFKAASTQCSRLRL